MNYMSNGKDMIIHLIVGLIKKSHIKMSQYFPKPFNSHFGDSIKVKNWSKQLCNKKKH